MIYMWCLIDNKYHIALIIYFYFIFLILVLFKIAHGKCPCPNIGEDGQGCDPRTPTVKGG